MNIEEVTKLVAPLLAPPLQALAAVEEQLKWLDAIEEQDPSSSTHKNASAGGVAAVIRKAINDAMGGKS